MVDIFYEPTDESTGVDLAGEVREITTTGRPTGYKYAATRYADVILEQSFGDWVCGSSRSAHSVPPHAHRIANQRRGARGIHQAC